MTPRRNSPYFAAIAAASLLAPATASAADYSWNAGAQSSWSNTEAWLADGNPAVIAPGSGDNIITPMAFAKVTVDAAEVANFTFDSGSSWEVIGAASISPFSVTGNLTKDGTGTLTLRNGSSKYLDLSIGGAVSVADGSLSLNNLHGFSAGSMNITGGTVNLSAETTESITTITGVLTMSGGSTLNIRNNTTGGTLSVGSLVSVGSDATIQVNATNSAAATATLELNNASGSATYAGVIRDTGKTAPNVLNVTKNGSGTQILTGNDNTYSGLTTVNDGALLINNTSGSGTGASVVTVNNGGTFGGTGFSTSSITVANGGVLLGGAGAAGDDLSLSGDVTFNDGSVIGLALGAAGAHSSLTRTDGVWMFDANQAFSILDLGATTGLYDNIISGLTGSEAGLTSISSWSIANDGWTGTFAYDDAGGIDLTLTSLTSIPEPSTYAAILGAGMLAVAGFRRRRR